MIIPQAVIKSKKNKIYDQTELYDDDSDDDDYDECNSYYHTYRQYNKIGKSATGIEVQNEFWNIEDILKSV